MTRVTAGHEWTVGAGRLPAGGGTLSTKGKRKEERKEGRKKRLIAKYSNGEERKRQKEKMRNSKTFPYMKNGEQKQERF